MQIFRNPYVVSIFSAVLTGVFVAFVIVAADKFISNHFFNRPLTLPIPAKRVPLYTTDDSKSLVSQQFLTPYSATGTIDNVDKEDATVTKPKPVPITATEYIVVAMNTSTSSPALIDETPALENNSDRAVPIASLTKLATAVVAENLLDQNASVTITKKIISTYRGDPGGLREGEKIRVGQLMYPMLMVSSNNAAEALSENYDPGRAWFIKAMNDWAYSIGAYNTYFADPSGLSSENISSPHDLAIMLAWIYIHRPELIAITETKTKSLGSHTWISPTQLLNFTSYLGGKNGYLPEAGETSVSLFDLSSTTPSGVKQINKKYIVVTLNSQFRDQDILNLLGKL